MSSYAVVDNSSGKVVNMIAWDGEGEWSPPDDCIAVETEVAGIGWDYANGAFVPPELEQPSAEDVKAANARVRDLLLAEAGRAIAPLQYAVDLEISTADDLALLKKWKKYSVDVNRIVLTLVAPEWPKSPVGL